MGIHGKHTRVLVDHRNLSEFFSEAGSSSMRDKAPCHGFGTNRKKYVFGQSDGTLTLSGYFDKAPTGAHVALRSAFNNEDQHVVTVGYDRLLVGTLADIIAGKPESYEVAGNVGDAVTTSAQVQSDSGVDAAIVLHGITNEAANGNAAAQDNAAASAKGGAGHLHVLSAAGADLVVVIEHSPDNSAWTPLITFASLDAVGFERVELGPTASVGRYVRAAWTRTSGNFTFVVAFARL